MPIRRRITLLATLSLALILLAAQAVAGAEPENVSYEFLSELAGMESLSGFPPALFQPESRPSRFEIAYFLYRFDQRLAAIARAGNLGLQGALARLWREANPDADPRGGTAWAERAALAYRRLLLQYHREMSALGFRLRPDAYPSWTGRNDDVLGD
ncbi:MAG: hypothetical protein ACM3ZC_11155 [Bacteroidota bacterium]